MKRCFYYTSMIALLLLTSCEIGLDFLNPAGDMREVERTITGRVSKISINDDVKVTIHFTDGRQYAVVKAGDNIIREVRTSMVDSTLTICNNSKLEWSTSYKNRKEVTLYLNNTLSTLSYFGIEDVTITDTIRTNLFTYYCNESGGRVQLREQHRAGEGREMPGREVASRRRGTPWTEQAPAPLASLGKG